MDTVNVSEIQSVLNAVAANLARERMNVPWTRAIKEGLCTFAQKQGYQVCASGCGEARWGEWLYDVVWLLVDKDDPTHTPNVLDSPLVVECEWGNAGDVLADFQKLLLARAEARLMIYQAAGSREGRTIARRLIEQVNFYRRGVPGDRYVMACFCNDTREFECLEYLKGAPADTALGS